MTEQTLFYIVGVLITMLFGIISFFLRGLISQIQARTLALEIKLIATDNKVVVIEANHNNLHDGVGELKTAVKDLTMGINQLTQKLTH